MATIGRCVPISPSCRHLTPFPAMQELSASHLSNEGRYGLKSGFHKPAAHRGGSFRGPFHRGHVTAVFDNDKAAMRNHGRHFFMVRQNTPRVLTTAEDE